MKHLNYDVDGFVTVRIRFRVKALNKNHARVIVEGLALNLQDKQSLWKIVNVSDDFTIEEVFDLEASR